jgi:pyruvate/2-oxoglutarate dehydrogenase complex dihydrolipoamide acyltransferase (E2) component
MMGRVSDPSISPSATVEVRSELQGTIVALEVQAGDRVRPATVLALVESMKLHHDVAAGVHGVVLDVIVEVGTTVHPGDVLLVVAPVAADAEPEDGGGAPGGVDGEVELTGERDDLRLVRERHEVGLDEHRPDAVEAPRARGTARRGRTW